MDNAPAHTATLARRKISDLGFTLLPHPPYSPDLAPSDYWLFPSMKEPLRGKRYTSFQALASAVSQWRIAQSADWYTTGMHKLEEQWKKCVTLRGDYVEKIDV